MFFPVSTIVYVILVSTMKLLSCAFDSTITIVDCVCALIILCGFVVRREVMDETFKGSYQNISSNAVHDNISEYFTAQKESVYTRWFSQFVTRMIIIITNILFFINVCVVCYKITTILLIRTNTCIVQLAF